jgi:3-methyladenine DNA glycosylase AlkC
MKEKFSLKDHLFNPERVEYLSSLIATAYPDFKKKEFQEAVLEKFPELELKERIVWIRECLKRFLPKEYSDAVNILIKSLPKECDPTKTDDDFGEFILAPLSDFVAIYGCTKEYLDFSLNTLEEMTKRFSVEDSIRYFLNAFPKKTLTKIGEWSQSKNYHVRRLASEGTRPRLPWSQKVHLDSNAVIKTILDNLYHDPTRYVVRSVANHLNDISKENPELVVETLERWSASNNQTEQEMKYLSSHSLRTLVKKGNSDALEHLGYRSSAHINIQKFEIETPSVTIGSAVEFSFNLTSVEKENLMIDYIIHFQASKGSPRPKVFKIKKASLEKGDSLRIQKRHPLRVMSTKKLYPGIHKITIQINGKVYEGGEFLLKT